MKPVVVVGFALGLGGLVALYAGRTVAEVNRTFKSSRGAGIIYQSRIMSGRIGTCDYEVTRKVVVLPPPSISTGEFYEFDTACGPEGRKKKSVYFGTQEQIQGYVREFLERYH